MGEKAKVVVRSVLTVATVGVALWLAVVEREVPPWLTGVIGGQMIDWYYGLRERG